MSGKEERIKVVVDEKDKGLFETVLRILPRKIPVSVEYADKPSAGAVNVGGEDFAGKDAACAKFLAENAPGEKWNMIFNTGSGGYIVSGTDLGRINCSFLSLLEDISTGVESVESQIKSSVFNRMYISFDDCSFGFSRAADDFDLELHMLEVVRLGFENFEINRIYDDIPIRIREKKVWKDTYQWWDTYMPALDQFYESSLTRGAYDYRMLKKNRKVLLETAALARGLGLKPIYTAFEPRAWPERLFDRYPELRGARVDYDAYSCEPEFAPDVNHPMVRNHYKELVGQLMRDVPDLELFEAWAQDSAGGYPWAHALYAGPNGPTRIRNMPVWKSVNSFLSAVKEEASKTNPDTRVNINIGWVFRDEEREEIVKNAAEGIGISYGFSRTGKDAAPFSDQWEIICRHPEKKADSQALRQEIGCNWKRYGPLFGFPFPRGTFDMLLALKHAGVPNVSLRGGIISNVYVPRRINNEIIQAFKHAGENLDVEGLLEDRAGRWTGSQEEARALMRAWELCDEFDSNYSSGYRLQGYTSRFVSSRTLFRKLVRPVVPDHSLLKYEESRYYKPHVFLPHETDPSQHDISYFNFQQQSSDENITMTVKHINEVLLPKLEEALSALEAAGAGSSEAVRDTMNRIRCFYFITATERDLLDTQAAIHLYKKSEDEKEKEELRGRIKENMRNNIRTTEEFIKLLKEAEWVLIPVTSGEETPYMFKAPLYNLLERKVKAMKNHMDDEPGPVFENGFYLGD